MRPQEHLKPSPAEYLAQERLAGFKSEYCDGEIFAMAGASRAHNQICSNIVASLGIQLQERPCSVYSSDMKVKIESARSYSYPDVVAACEPQQFEDEHSDVLLNPRLIVEILSDGTEAYDRGLKFLHYQRLASLQDYLLVSQKSWQVEKYQRQADNTWLYEEFHHPDDIITLASLACRLSLQDIYRKAGLAPPPA